jgi:hypothetical protein
VADEHSTTDVAVPAAAAAPEPAPVVGVPTDLVTIAPDALDLFVRVATIVHGPAPEADKLAFVVHTACAAAGAPRGAFVRLDEEKLDAVHVAGSLSLDALDAPTRVELVRRTLRAGAVLEVAATTAVLAVPVPRHEQRPHGALVVIAPAGGRW